MRCVLALSRIRGIGPMRVGKLVKGFGSARAVVTASQSILLDSDLVNESGARAIAAASPVPADHPAVEFYRRHREHVGALTCSDAHYPDLLRQITQPPPLLWTRGHRRIRNEPCVALVGSRNATERGKALAWKWAFDLASAGITIVSGLAVGIDAAAHQGALDAGGCTVAVMGTGIDRIYPGRNRRLAEDIVNDGILMTEFDPGQGARPHHFPRRNRIIAGLSHVVVVIEAAKDSGALITARMAQDEGREVGIVPGRPGDAKAAGANAAIRDHLGVLVSEPVDVLNMLRDMPGQHWSFPNNAGASREQEPGKSRNKSNYSRRRSPLRSGTASRTIKDHLVQGPVSVELLARETGIEREELEHALLDLLLDGRVLLGEDQRYRWNAKLI